MWGVLKLAARAAVWRTTAEPQLAGLPVLLGISILTAAVRMLLQLAAALPSHAFNPYGLNAVVAWIALELAVAALFVRPGARVTALSAMFILSISADHRYLGDQARLPAARSRYGRGADLVEPHHWHRDPCRRRDLVGWRHGLRRQ